MPASLNSTCKRDRGARVGRPHRALPGGAARAQQLGAHRGVPEQVRAPLAGFERERSHMGRGLRARTCIGELNIWFVFGNHFGLRFLAAALAATAFGSTTNDGATLSFK